MADESSNTEGMWRDIALQAIMILGALFAFLFIHNVPQSLLSKLRHWRARHSLQAKRHFVLGAQLLSRARASPAAGRRSLAGRAASEADMAISLDPADAAHHVLKALALELQGFTTSALDSLDAALSPLAAGSLGVDERADALVKRAEMRMKVAGGAALVEEDLAEAVKVLGAGESGKAYGLLGEWYEKKGMREEARKAYEDAVRVRPDYDAAREGLARLVSS